MSLWNPSTWFLSDDESKARAHQINVEADVYHVTQMNKVFESLEGKSKAYNTALAKACKNASFREGFSEGLESCPDLKA